MEIIFGPEEAHGASKMDQKNPEAPTRVGGAPRGVGAPPYLVASSKLPLCGLQVSRVAFLPKISSVKFQVNWTPFDFPLLRYSKTRKKQKLSLGSGLIG